MILGYSEEEVRGFNLTRSSSPNCAQRQDTGSDVWSWVWMEWMTVTSLKPCHALHVPQHVAAVESDDFSRSVYRNSIAYLD